AKHFGVENGQIVGVKVDSGKGRAVVFMDTVIRVSSKYALAMHIDTDESNACCGAGVIYGEIVSK
ncbi:MAG TPA: propanediol utilization protein, partial [Firmicutes bacterium]|nr:propanediol utilization protein [Bacillota bacterium]